MVSNNHHPLTKGGKQTDRQGISTNLSQTRDQKGYQIINTLDGVGRTESSKQEVSSKCSLLPTNEECNN